MKTKRNVEILLENGIHFTTISKMKPNEVKLLSEKFFKPKKMTKIDDSDLKTEFKNFIKKYSKIKDIETGIEDLDDEKIIDMMKAYSKWSQTEPNKEAGKLYQRLKGETKEAVTQKVAQTITTLDDTDLSKGMAVPNDPNTGDVQIKKVGGKVQIVTGSNSPMSEEKEIDEKFESRSQQKLFFAKCGNGKTKEQKKWCKMRDEFSRSTTKKDQKNMPEKVTKEGYERYLEDRIVEMIERHVEPRMTKGDILRTISERTGNSDSIMLSNPKRNTMFSKNEGMEMKGMGMKRPIGKISSMSGEMGENTKEKERTKTPGTKTTPKRRDNPFKDPNPDVKEKPKANTRTKEAPAKPGVKTPPKRRDNPFKDPNPGVKEKPKAEIEGQKNEFIGAIKQALNM
jgi:hypothetical protein